MLLQTTPCSTLWGVGELVLSSETDYANPFRDVAVTGIFRAPSGREVRALGFEFLGVHVAHVHHSTAMTIPPAEM